MEAEDRATKEAEARYPTDPIANPGLRPDVIRENVVPMVELSKELSAKYRDRVRQKHGLTESEMQKIAVEGTTKDWPLPEL